MLETFVALGEPNRLRIVEELRRGPRSVGHLTERLALSQPLVSKHLKVLRDAGLVGVEPRARQRIYELRAKPLCAMHQWLERYRQVWDARFEALDELLVELERDEATATSRREKEPSHGRKKRR